MFYLGKQFFLSLLIALLSANLVAQEKENSISSVRNLEKLKDKKTKRKKYKLPEIDLSHWKVTIPAGDPAEVAPPEILDYANNDVLKKYMYNDSVQGALVFYVIPDATTTNTKYSRSELREQMEPGNNHVNWTFKQGGIMKGRLAMGEVSKDKNGKYHKVIIMQIHGRLTNEQRDLIGQKDNNAPPVLKIYWQDGKIRLKTKELKDLSLSETDILKTDSWTDDKGYTFKEEVGFRPFNLEVKVSEGKLVVSLNKTEYAVYEGIHMQKWGVFENYFKAGNYLQTVDKNAHASIKYFELEVSH
jgi:hypothetical protein